MPPRGRPRKPRLSRMDAAVDAMVPFGFSENRVKKVVKQLLKEYGGDEAWPFIEDCSYKELIEALLRAAEDTDDQGKSGGDENQSKEKSLEGETAAGTSAREGSQPQRHESNAPEDVAMSTAAVAQPTCSDVPSSSSGVNNGDGKGWKDILPDGLTDQTPTPVQKIDDDSTTEFHPPCNNNSILTSPSPKNIPLPAPTNDLPTCRHRPCYGWIDSDEEGDPDDFIFLGSAPKELTKSLNDGAKMGKGRKSRWDIAP